MPRLLSSRRLVATAVVLGVCAVSASAQAWTEARTAHFTVISNGGERNARSVAWQFEQIHAAMEAGWPWARVTLDRPILVLVAKDESSMRALVPEYWEKGQTLKPSSVFVSGPDRHYIALRGDVKPESQIGVNPYYASYWSYAALTLEAAFAQTLPLWLRDGLAGVISNSIVGDDVIEFGRPVPWYVESLRTEGRLRLAQLMSLESSSPYYKGVERDRFDAQAWGVVSYLLFGRPDDKAAAINTIAAALIAGKSSAQAVTEVFGSVDALETDYLRYTRQPIFRFGRLKTETSISKNAPVRVLPRTESAGLRAVFLAVTGRPNEARAAGAESKKADATAPWGDEAEAMLLEREKKPADARAALERAASTSSNFYTHYRLAAMSWRENPDAETLAGMEASLKRSTELNPAYAPAFEFLAEILIAAKKPGDAINAAAKAMTLRPRDAQPRLSMARALFNQSRFDVARVHANVGLSLAQTPEERQLAQSILDALDRVPK